MVASDTPPMRVNGGMGGSMPNAPFAILAVYTGAPGLPTMVPASAGVTPVPVPEVDWDAPKASAYVGWTPVYADSNTPPFEIGEARFARTASTVPWSGFGSGNPWTFV